MKRSIHLGYTCPKCWTRVPVYTFTKLNGDTVATPPEDQSVECPNCHLPRTMRFALLEHLDRWEGPAKALPPKPVPEPTTAAGGGAKFYREFTRGACGSGIPLDYQRAQLVKGNGCVYVVSRDGTTLIVRNESAKQLCDKYSEQSKSGAGEWDFCIRLTIQVAAPVGG